MADYPDGVYSPRTKENLPGIAYDADKKTIGYVEDITKLDDEVVAIETELGINPKGEFGSVAERLAACLVNNDNDYMAGVLTNTGLNINQGSGIGIILRGIAGGATNILSLGSAGNYSLSILGNSSLDQPLLKTSSPTFNMPYVTSIYYNNVYQDYKYVTRTGYFFGLQGQSSGIQSSYEYFTKDGDGTDNLNFILWAEGTPDSISPGSLMQFGYITNANPALRYYKLATQPIGEGGNYPLKIYTAANTDQIKLHIDGGVTMATLKSGINQEASGAVANELWIDTADNSIKVGV